MKRRTKPKPPASIVPHEVVVLAIDPGEKAGAAVLVRGRVTDVLAIRPGAEPLAVELAKTVARDAALPLVVVAEKWSNHGVFGGARTQRGLGAAWGRWDGALLAGGIPRRVVVRVLPRTWQAKIVSGIALPRERLAAAVASVADRALRQDPDAPLPANLTLDQAAAVCIGLWAARAGEVAAVMPKPRAPRKARAPRAQKGAKAA